MLCLALNSSKKCTNSWRNWTLLSHFTYNFFFCAADKPKLRVTICNRGQIRPLRLLVVIKRPQPVGLFEKEIKRNKRVSRGCIIARRKVDGTVRVVLQDGRKGISGEHKSDRARNNRKCNGAVSGDPAEAASQSLRHKREALLQIQNLADPSPAAYEYRVR